MVKLFSFLALALIISFLCSILEAVLLSTTLPFISTLESKNKKRSILLKKLKTQIDRPIAAILTVNTIAHTIGAAGVGAESAKIFGNQYMFLISALLTILILYFSEIIPKTIGAVYWKKLAIPSAQVINILIYITYPLTILAEYTTRLISKNKKISISRDELLANTLLSENSGAINESESDIIENTLELSKSKVKDILTPRSVVFAFEKSINIEEAIKHIDNLKTFSRIPVYDLDIDHIVGKVLSKDILWKSAIKENPTLDDLITPIASINENTSVSKALSMLLSKNEHLFIVNDSYGQTEGVVSLEDCLETLLGQEILDEFDKVEDMQVLARQFLNVNKIKRQ